MLKRVLDGNLDPAGALKRIRGARRCVARVEKLLAWFGEKDPAMPLAQRFRRVQRRVELGGVSRDSELWFGELTMAVHRLNVQLSRHFYPGEADNL